MSCALCSLSAAQLFFSSACYTNNQYSTVVVGMSRRPPSAGPPPVTVQRPSKLFRTRFLSSRVFALARLLDVDRFLLFAERSGFVPTKQFVRCTDCLDFRPWPCRVVPHEAEPRPCGTRTSKEACTATSAIVVSARSDPPSRSTSMYNCTMVILFFFSLHVFRN